VILRGGEMLWEGRAGEKDWLTGTKILLERRKKF
jgi:hypothetical protein